MIIICQDNSSTGTNSLGHAYNNIFRLFNVFQNEAGVGEMERSPFMLMKFNIFGISLPEFNPGFMLLLQVFQGAFQLVFVALNAEAFAILPHFLCHGKRKLTQATSHVKNMFAWINLKQLKAPAIY